MNQMPLPAKEVEHSEIVTRIAECVCVCGEINKGNEELTVNYL
jgi:hypothetical protein